MQVLVDPIRCMGDDLYRDYFEDVRAWMETKTTEQTMQERVAALCYAGSLTRPWGGGNRQGRCSHVRTQPRELLLSLQDHCRTESLERAWSCSSQTRQSTTLFRFAGMRGLASLLGIARNLEPLNLWHPQPTPPQHTASPKAQTQNEAEELSSRHRCWHKAAQKSRF